MKKPTSSSKTPSAPETLVGGFGGELVIAPCMRRLRLVENPRGAGHQGDESPGLHTALGLEEVGRVATVAPSLCRAICRWLDRGCRSNG
jgi:hypothetical protein